MKKLSDGPLRDERFSESNILEIIVTVFVAVIMVYFVAKIIFF